MTSALTPSMSIPMLPHRMERRCSIHHIALDNLTCPTGHECLVEEWPGHSHPQALVPEWEVWDSVSGRRIALVHGNSVAWEPWFEERCAEVDEKLAERDIYGFTAKVLLPKRTRRK